MFINANQVADGANIDADLCIVGCGAAGITLAKELDGSDLKIVVLEAGDFEYSQQLEKAFYPFDVQGLPIRTDIPTRRMQYGGSTNAWFGRIAQFDPIDFRQRSWVPNSGWPIDADAIAPYLDRAAETLGIPHHTKMATAAWQDSPTHTAFNSDSLTTSLFFWAERYLMGPTYHQQLSDSKNVTVYLNAHVQTLETEHGEHVTHADLRGRSDNRFHVRASHFVLATGGHENARLLLLSRNQVEAGLGNQHDNVGRYLVDHPRSEGVAHIELANTRAETIAKVALLGEKAPSRYGPVQMVIQFDEALQEREQLLNHCVHAHLIRAGQELAGWNALRQLLKGAGEHAPNTLLKTVAKDLPSLIRYVPGLVMGNAPLKFVGLVDQMEQEPDANSRVYLSDTARDGFGNPLLAVDWRVSRATQRSRVRMHQLISQRVVELGIGTMVSTALGPYEIPTTFLDMKHPCGTTRMSASPADGVVDANGRVHGIRNLSIVGSSTFPTAGHANPTYTIVALAIRLADQLKRELATVSAIATAS